MARLPYRSPEDLDPEYRELLSRPINLFRLLANSPGALKMWHQFGEWIRWDSVLDPRLRELAIAYVGYLTSSDYEFSHHVPLAQQFGATDEDLAGLARVAAGEPTHFSELDLTVLRVTRNMTEDIDLAQTDWDELAGALGAEALEDLVVIVGFYNMVVRVIAAVRLDVEPDYQGYLAEFPLPGRTFYDQEVGK